MAFDQTPIGHGVCHGQHRLGGGDRCLAPIATPCLARLGLAHFARLSSRPGFVRQATASASDGFTIAHDW